MSPFADAAFWRRLDGYIDRVVRRRAWPLRAVVRGVRRGARVPSAVVELLRGQVVDEVEQAQPYGVRSAVPEGMESIAVGIGGSSAHWVLVGDLDRAHAPTDLDAGEVVLYSQHGQTIRLQADGSVQIDAPGEVFVRSEHGQELAFKASGGLDVTSSGELLMRSTNGQLMRFNSAGQTAIVGSPIRLNGPGAGVARIGDTVTLSASVTIGGTPYPVVGTGTISTGSATVQAGG